jgi:dolichyl-phosphate-mannose--protein O-mannosyl transferase
MLTAQLHFRNASHPNESAWFQWPILWKVFWIDSSFGPAQSDGNLKKAIVLVGNPLILWTGMIAILICTWAWIRKRDSQARMISLLFFALYGSWILIPRQTMFFYYYFPAAMMLGPAITYSLNHFNVPPRGRWVLLATFAVVFAFSIQYLLTSRSQSLHI